jgi:hypothetical protein
MKQIRYLKGLFVNYLKCFFSKKELQIRYFRHDSFIVIEGAFVRLYWDVQGAYKVEIKEIGFFINENEYTLKIEKGREEFILIAYGVKGVEKQIINVRQLSIERQFRFNHQLNEAVSPRIQNLQELTPKLSRAQQLYSIEMSNKKIELKLDTESIIQQLNNIKA